MKKKAKLEVKASVDRVPPKWGASASDDTDPTDLRTRSRRNRSATIDRSDKYINIENGFLPFKRCGNSSNISIEEIITLCQKAYCNFAIFRNTIDVMSEFSSSNIYFRGGNKKARDFFTAYFRKIGIWSLTDRFFREYYLSGNVFLYRIDGTLKSGDVDKITQTFGAESLSAKTKLPLRYIILNPADIRAGGTTTFFNATYYKELNSYELEILRNPRTDEDKEIFESLPPQVREDITNKGNGNVLMPLDPKQILAVFYKKFDYFPFSAPMGLPVLEDINWKAEMKKMDMSITRTFQQIILLVTTGAPEDKGGFNPENLRDLQNLFANESIGRVLVADFTTEAKFVVPEIANLLDPKKYEQIDKDIKLGLNYILSGDNEKFANQSIRVKVFIERLKQAREAFINEFLQPEIKRISKDLGFKNFPTPYFDDINLKDDAEWQRITSRLMEVGMLTAEEGFNAMETGRLPSPEDSVESQRKFKEYRDEGLYQPLVGGPADQKDIVEMTGDQQEKLAEKTGEQQMQMHQEKMDQNERLQVQKIKMQTGRPAGTGKPQRPRKSSPVGASESLFSMTKVTDNLIASNTLEKKIESLLKKRFNIEKLSDEQQSVAREIKWVVMANEEPKDWQTKAKQYVENPVDTNAARINEIHDIAYNFQTDSQLATLLFHSKI